MQILGIACARSVSLKEAPSGSMTDQKCLFCLRKHSRLQSAIQTAGFYKVLPGRNKIGTRIWTWSLRWSKIKNLKAEDGNNSVSQNVLKADTHERFCSRSICTTSTHNLPRSLLLILWSILKGGNSAPENELRP